MKLNIFVSVFQLAVGIAGIISFVIIAFSGEELTKWIGTLVLSIAFVVLGIMGIKEYRNQSKGE